MTAFTLKMIAAMSMLIGNIELIFPMYTPAFFQAIGKVAFPIFAFMIAQGCTHTKDIHKYMTRLGIFALISEIPFDIAFNRHISADRTYGLYVSFLTNTNALYTLFLGAACIAIYKGLLRKTHPWLALLPFSFVPAALVLSFIPYLLVTVMIFYTAIALYCSHFLPDADACLVITMKHKVTPFLAAMPLLITACALSTDFGAFGVGLIFLLYLGNPSNKTIRAFILIVATLYYYGIDLIIDPAYLSLQQLLYDSRFRLLLFALVAVLLVHFYNGERGRKVKWTFYAFYPTHIAILITIWYVYIGM